jgi:putative flavoprotein involved in K+ transport
MDGVANMLKPERFEVVVIGAGQAGLAIGYLLTRRGLRFVILDEQARVGDSWRNRWDSLRLFTPARYDGLPGMRFPAPPHSFPTRDEMADYLEAYAAAMELPVRNGCRVDRLERATDGDGYLITCGDRTISATNVVVATGGYRAPRVPDFARKLDARIRQLHSSEYRNQAQLQEGDVLVVGAGNSGAEIAVDVAPHHRTWLSGRDTGHVPIRIESSAARVIARCLWFLANHVLTVDTPVGRKFRPVSRSRSGALVRVKPADLQAAGVERVIARTVGAREGKPQLDDGQVLVVANVIWCTGWEHGFDWIDLPITGPDGWPEQHRGVVPSAPGLYFLGLPFLYALSSSLVGGVGRDAAFIAARIAERHANVRRGRSEPLVGGRLSESA